jgi:DNA-binding HxlR family transcriptional regulator
MPTGNNIEEDVCPVTAFLGLISNKWKVHIVWALLDGKKRFGELCNSIPAISQKVLTDNLRSMERDGLLTRKVYAVVPPRVEYSLSELGRSLHTVLETAQAWGVDYLRAHKR